MPEQLFTVKQAADLMGLTARSVYRYIDDGFLKAVRIGQTKRAIRIPASELEALTANQKS